MKTVAFVALALAPLSAVAQSYSGTGYSGSTTWGGTISSGYGYGPSYGGSYWGYPVQRPGQGRYPVWGWGSGWGSGFGTGFGGSYYGGYSGYWGQEGPRERPFGAASTAGPLPPAPGAERGPEAASARDVEEGRRRFRSGDYRGAVDAFRSSVAAHPENPVAQAWFSVGLVMVGEGRNADKALRSAVGGGLGSGALSLDGMFRDDKERVRLIVALAKVGPEGGLTAAYALALAGEPVRLKQIAEKDPVARQLLPKP